MNRLGGRERPAIFFWGGQMILSGQWALDGRQAIGVDKDVIRGNAPRASLATSGGPAAGRDPVSGLDRSTKKKIGTDRECDGAKRSLYVIRPRGAFLGAPTELQCSSRSGVVHRV